MVKGSIPALLDDDEAVTCPLLLATVTRSAGMAALGVAGFA
jgi:hypothetical protein